MPALVEADDDFLYVLKFRGAGQGVKALIAELIVGELARMLGLRVPEIVFANLNPAFGRSEPDEEIQDLLRASTGLNLALHYLSGAITFDPLVTTIDATLASQIVWLDCFVTNVDRPVRNTNLLMWHRELWLIDHGAALYFHHSGQPWQEQARRPFAPVKDHVLLLQATELDTVDAHFRALLTNEHIRAVVALIPEEWLMEEAAIEAAEEQRLRAVPNMPEKHLFEYAVIRVMPRVERQEFLNVGIILYCPAQGFLQTLFTLNEGRLRAVFGEINRPELDARLQAFERICAGRSQGGAIGQLPIAARFRWLTATRSTVVQTSAVHPGLCADAAATLTRLFADLVE